jgi:hypothetical protein
MTSSPTIEHARPAVAPARVPASDRDQARGGSSLFGRSTNALLVVLVAFGALLRVWGVGANRLGYDEAFTAMAGRHSLGDLFDYLRLNDSHPPLDYLIRLPLARAGVDELWFRMPSVACSVAALALFAWWMRRRGAAGVIATGLLAVSAFQLIHGRAGRMYAELELLGVVAAVLSDGWLRRPRRWHAPAIGVLVFLTLLTHVSGFLLAAGLFALPGFRRDREAWRWRAAIAGGGFGWSLLWGPSFLVQARGGHSDWIPSTTVDGMVHTYARLVAYDPQLHVIVLLAVVAGGVVVWRRDRQLGRVLVCCAVVPALLAAATGTVAPVLLDRTLTFAAWGPLLAIGFLVGAIAQRARVVAAVVIVAIAIAAVPAAINVVETRSGPDRALRHLEQVVRPGDVVATRPSGKLPELAWSIGVRGPEPFHTVSLTGLGHTAGFELGHGTRSGRIWLLDWTRRPLPGPDRPRCAPDWSPGSSRVLCLR